MESPLEHNRLGDEPSPYLQQHADNPVNWQPWDDTALDGATDRDVPIFCSIGYAACHWCHVMAEESFEDERVANRLNDAFVPIKVDREERPDIDRIYQTISQLVGGTGGWPLSVFLTPDERPFYVGTYFPPTAKRGRPGFLELLDRIASSWESDRASIEERAGQWQEALRQEVEVTTGANTDSDVDPDIEEVARAALHGADRVHGGFGERGPKFPQPQRIALLLRAHVRLDEDDYLDVAAESLDAMADRGMYDHLGGGFHRYATDREWRIPHFEKMLYDNAELPRVYLAAHQLTGRPRFASVVEETLGFVMDELRHPDGGFYSTLDAQSEGMEGAYYVWTPSEVREVVGDEDVSQLVCDRFGITDSGNFEEHTTVLARTQSIEHLAEEYGMAEPDVRETLASAREALRAARSERPRPARDEKILTGWNGLMVSAFAEAGLILDREWIEPAREAMAFVREELWDDGLSRRYKDGDVGVPGYLDDYAYLARGARDLYYVTGEFEWLAFAVDLADEIVADFWDEREATMYFTPESGETLVSRPQDPHDQSTPSSLAVAMELLVSLHMFVPDRGFEAIVRSILEEYRSAIAGAPLQHVGIAAVADRFHTGQLEWTIVAEEVPPDWRRTITAAYAPDHVIARRPPDQETLDRWVDRLGCEEVPPIWSERTQRDDRPTVYVCRDFTCSPPLTDPAEAGEWLDRFDGRVEPASD